jgi:FkbM family methyltransferase
MKETVTLPTGAVVSCFEKIESSMLISEIFKRQVYPLDLFDKTRSPVILDFGANVGFFVHFAKSRFPDAIVHAVEPVPLVAQVLRENVKRFGRSVHVHECAISDRDGDGTINFYPGYSVMSGLVADAQANEKLLSSCVKHDLLRKLPSGKVVTDRHVQVALANRLDNPTSHRCKLIEVNDFLQNHVDGYVDYLKMDVEGSELCITRAISEENWAKIGSVVMEIHEYEGREESAPLLIAILNKQGFVTKTVYDGGEGENRTLMLYGRREHKASLR